MAAPVDMKENQRKEKKAFSHHFGSVLMVPPDHFKVEYAINPWMGGVVDKAKAHRQWDDLKTAIEQAGCPVHVLPQVEGLPDMVFVCNSGLVLGNKVFLAKFRYKERTGEEQHYKKWFKERGYELHGMESKFCFEGGGDSCFATAHQLWAGYGARTDMKVSEGVRLPFTEKGNQLWRTG